MKRRRVEAKKTDRLGASSESTNGNTSQMISEGGIKMTNRQFSHKRIRQALGLLVLALLVAGYSVTATNGQHRNSEIPGSSFVFIFSPIAYGIYPDPAVAAVQSEIRELVRRVDDHNYRPIYYLSGRPSQPPPRYDGFIPATAENFKSILQEPRGILFVSSHGGNDLLVVESMSNMGDCQAKVQEYVNNRIFNNGELSCVNFPGRARLWVLDGRALAVGRFWKNNLDGNTVWRDGLGNVQSSADGGQDHTGPNNDPFVWRVWCVEKKSGTSFNFTVPVGTGGTCKAKTPALGSINISEIWATVLNSKTNQPLPQGTPVTFTVNLKPGVEKLQHISEIDSIIVSAPGFKPKEIKGPFSAMGISIPGPSPVTIQIINWGTVALDPA